MKKGFTLIELLIVVAIIGILAAVGASLIPRVLENTKRTTAEGLCHQVIAEIKTLWTGCSAGIPLHLVNYSGVLDTTTDWCTFTKGKSNSMSQLTQNIVNHYQQLGTYKNPYRTNVDALNISCPLDDNLKPGCNELFGIEVTGEFVFQCYNLDSNGSLTKYREHFQTR